jgi:hypothetical protein
MEMKMDHKRLGTTIMLAGLSLVGANRASAHQDTPPQVLAAASDPASFDEDIKLLRRDLRSMKKQIIAANMRLTDEESQRFWPVYDRYTAELTALTDRKFALLKDYALNYDAITNERAETYVKERAAVEQSIMQLRLTYFPEFRKALSGRATARFFQMDWRLGLVAELQLASQTPLVEQ